MMRLFIALCFDEAVKAALEEGIARLQATALKGNFTRVGNLHLTLVFIGETDRRADIERAMDSVDAPAFEVAVQGFGRFRRGGRDICWAGVRGGPALSSMHDALCAALTAERFAIEKRPFKPHITLGRDVELPRSFDERAFAEGMPAASMRAGHISLMWSHRVDGVLTYTEIHKRALR
jgi:2'-5' RNA ligase